jgi:starvation-inducible DNA-binding protein
MNTAEQLTQVFNDNFVAYFKSHVSHVNIVGRNFASDHQLLNGIYDDLQDQIDVIAELLRTIYEFMPNDLQGIIEASHLHAGPVEGDSIELLTGVYDDIEHLKSCYEELISIAEQEGHSEIANYAQDRVLALSKHCWMLRATLE